MALVTHYFTYVGHGTNTKNNLQKEFKTYLESLQCTLIDAVKLNLYLKQIREKAQELNDKYKRCTPLVISFSELHSKNGLMISGFYFLTFQILEAYHDNSN
jgi:hypothetical protein